ncbi:oxalate:formate antiporter-like [Littorina saxatilis]|uniref:Major facilitator superfamily (MFS) profile domain-containing protein n=1 Tax=Littorina saxatilis TaxID=31220 RepID=A0AAN9AR73_9CAEN
MVCCGGKLPLKGILTIVGGFIVHLTLGTQLTYGNTNPYLVSYIRNSSSPEDLKYIDGIWIQACMLMGQGVSMFLGGIMEVKLGPRIATLIGAWFLSAGVLLTYFTVKVSFITSVLTYGVMFGLGCGASYAIPVGAAMRWFPEHRGLVGGSIFMGFGLGSVIFNQIITVFINPDNLSPDFEGADGDTYFTQPEILDRVPTLFLILGGTYAAMQFVAFFLISDPPVEHTTDHLPGESYKVTVTVADMSNGDNKIWTTPESTTVSTATLTTKENGLTAPQENQEMSVDELKEETEEPEMDVKPLQMLRTRMFYLIWVLFLLGGLGGVFLASQYKSYGQTFIKDDRFFSIVGSCASALNAVSGMFWGWVADRYTFKMAVQMLYVIFASVAYTLSSAEETGRAFFLIWICLVYFCLSGIYAIMPPAIGRIYGNKYIGINYGLIYTSQILTSAASAFVGQLLIDQIGYHGLFYLIGGSITLGLLLAIMIYPKTPDGKAV